MRKAVAPGSQKNRGDERRQIRDERAALDDLVSLVYEELRRLASFVRRGEFRDTVNTTALVHEAWLKLKDTPQVASTSRSHFMGIAARAMRQVLVDESRRRRSRKRGGDGAVVFVALDDVADAIAPCDEELIALDTALRELEHLDPRQARIVECRFFGGLSVAETAELLGVSESVIERDWRAAKAWLGSRCRPGSE